MTQTEALSILKKESGCRKYVCDVNCDTCERYVHNRALTQAIDIAISALEQVIEREDDGR